MMNLFFKERRVTTVSIEVKKSQHKYVIGPKGHVLQEILATTGGLSELFRQNYNNYSYLKFFVGFICGRFSFCFEESPQVSNKIFEDIQITVRITMCNICDFKAIFSIHAGLLSCKICDTWQVR
jgi:ABC-type dipeptide/oligopeptide/nickel transport system permease component